MLLYFHRMPQDCTLYSSSAPATTGGSQSLPAQGEDTYTDEERANNLLSGLYCLLFTYLARTMINS